MYEFLELGAILLGCVVTIIGVIGYGLWQDHQIMKQKNAWRRAEKWNWD